ncbi:nuclear transport factor 2 family protein [Hymenobacter cellulosilyticus]|uniref:Nuclear transport factor 2 family protein n=1 Tax=Hymenobacter cellulosilyticus TaxID=2932248 RepID=A0A8T9Q4P0_9BACT|nr:nuclear transport factor 2 family protein [Hymenobacter cellulosilyticus]UOQ70760.1 nuclear transport factor 2 family protein [Hymenobacter cellulosilyticus]
MHLPSVSLVLLTLVLGPAGEAQAQQATPATITQLEQQERQAVLRGDTTALKKLWAPEFVVNNPDNQIVTRPQILGFLRSGKIDYTTFERVIEKITITGDVAVAMGREIVTPEKKTTHAGKTVTRRYTDVWVRQGGAWRLTARQATNIVVQ